MLYLSDLQGIGQLLQGSQQTEVTGIFYNSRRVTPGGLFVAVPGLREDGHSYVAEAVARGATTLVVERPVAAPAHVSVIQVADSRLALAQLSQRFWGDPSQALKLIGVTGTNGKTTTSFLCRTLLEAAGLGVGLIGTVTNVVGGQELPVTRTTPESPDIAELLSAMAKAGDAACVMEVSSHALALGRVAGLEYDVAVFTNLSQDHLDFHQTTDNYLAAKAQLFWGLGKGAKKPGPKVAVLNADDPASRQLTAGLPPGVRQLTYGLAPSADVSAKGVQVSAQGVSFTVVTPQGEEPVALHLTGRFNVYNALAAVAVGLSLGLALPQICRALEAATGVPGRLEKVEAGQPFGCFVDYAHTPDGLENVLSAARAFTEGQILLVFGAGGDRDKGKRPQMGAIAAQWADVTLLTSDNPRSEEPGLIIEEIKAGFLAAGGHESAVETYIDRYEAIERAISLAQPGDVVLIAGKGHETTQNFGTHIIDFDDRAMARRAIRHRLNGEEAGA